MVIVTHESYDSVLVGTGKQKGLTYRCTQVKQQLMLAAVRCVADLPESAAADEIAR